MIGARVHGMNDNGIRHESDFAPSQNEAQTLGLSPIEGGQGCPQHCPYCDHHEERGLGEALGIAEVAHLSEGAEIWEQSIFLRNYRSVLSLLWIKEPISKQDDTDDLLPELDPFGVDSVKRRR